MKKIAIVVDSVMPTYFNKLLIESLNVIYKENYLYSINIFAKNINWPFKPVEYGIFKIHDYQNFSGDTIVTNFELLSYVLDVPHNNKINLYCYDFPWIVPNYSVKKVLNFLTSTKDSVYCNYDYITEFMKTFNLNVKTLKIDAALREVLNG